MKIPAVRERVRIKGHKGVFLVVGVDRERQVADLISTSNGGHVEEDVPFASIEPLDDGRQNSSRGKQLSGNSLSPSGFSHQTAVPARQPYK